MKKLKEKVCKAPKPKGEKGRCNNRFNTYKGGRKYCSRKCQNRADYEKRKRNEQKRLKELEEYGCKDEIELKESKFYIDLLRDRKKNIQDIYKKKVLEFPVMADPGESFRENLPKRLFNEIRAYRTLKSRKNDLPNAYRKEYEKILLELYKEELIKEIFIILDYNEVNIQMKKSVEKVQKEIIEELKPKTSPKENVYVPKMILKNKRL